MLNVMTMHLKDEVDLEKLWRVKSMGVEELPIPPDEYTRPYQETCITYNNGQYVAILPWKDDHPSLPSNELISQHRTMGVFNRLKKEPELLQKYGEILTEQEKKGFTEKVADKKINVGTKVLYILQGTSSPREERLSDHTHTYCIQLQL